MRFHIFLLSLLCIYALIHCSHAWTRFNRHGKRIEYSQSFSDENKYSGRQTALIAGIVCSGRYCDNKKLVTVRYDHTYPVQYTGHWTRWFSDENPNWANCPADMVVNEIQCSGRYCDNMRLQCGRLQTGYRVDVHDIRIANWFSEEEGERLCPDGYYLWGMACRGRYCDGIKLNCARVDYQATDKQWKILTKGVGNIVRSRWFSEEDGGFSGRMNGPLAGVKCQGRYCDSKQMVTVQRGAAFSVINAGWWSGWFSDGSPDSANCPVGMVVNEIQCRGRYCDDMRIQCGEMAPGYRVNRAVAEIANWYSEEEGERLCSDGYYVYGMACRGDYCDGIRLSCALVEYDPTVPPPPPPSDEFLARKFAPQMRFDQKADQFPFPVQDYWAASSFENGARVLSKGFRFSSSFDPSKMGLSYTISRCATSTRITYWAFYKGQQTCFGPFGEHEGDWEHVVVELTADFAYVRQVQFVQHGGWYSRYPGSMEMVGTHVVVYVGKKSNGQYHDSGGNGLFCQYFEDFRNPESSGKIWDSWKTGKLAPTNTKDPWNTFSGSWGRDGISGPNPQDGWFGGVCVRNHCRKDGCNKSMGL